MTAYRATYSVPHCTCTLYYWFTYFVKQTAEVGQSRRAGEGWRADKRRVQELNCSQWQQVRIMMSRTLLGVLVSLAIALYPSGADGAPL